MPHELYCQQEVTVTRPWQGNIGVRGDVSIRLVCVALLLWALVPINPYGYYILLRWICCASFLYLAVWFYKRGRTPWVWAFGVLAGLYNPFIAVHLGRSLWRIVNVATVALLLLSLVLPRARRD